MNLRSLSEYLPTGGSISAEDFQKRHRLIWLVLALHLPVVVVVGLLSDMGLVHVVIETGPLFILAWIVTRPLSRAALANVTSFALLAVSAELIHFTHGMPEMHMHLLVMLVLVALYEDVRAYFIAVGFVVVHHIGLSLIAGNGVFAQQSARNAPVLWSLLHAGLVILETGIIMVFWKSGHDSQMRLQQALSAQTTEIDGRRHAEIERTSQAAELERRLSAEVHMKHELNLRTTELALQAGAVGSGMEDIGNAISHLASTAHGIGQSVAEASHVTAQATAEARATTAVIAELRESRGQIEEILQVIHSIAGKTNLLALNATIEAARAGTVGRGFAVVAGEVKALAGQTARAVADIATTLESIGSGTEAAVGAMDRISSVVDHIGTLQQNIATAVEDQQQSSDDIARTITTASADVARVLGGVRELAQV